MDYTPEALELDHLLLDPNNYRFLDMGDYVSVAPERCHEDTVQERVFMLIQRDGLDELRALKESIEVNGYLPIEALIVRPYPHGEGLYIVVEGNRRVAAMRWLQRDHDAGAAVSPDLLDGFTELPALVVDPQSPDFARTRQVLLGLRHVSGIKEWGGYQRAQVVTELVDREALTPADAAKAIGMTSHEAMRRYRAFKALEQMKRDEEFGAQAKPEMYPLFHEAVAQPSVRDWLGWYDETYEFTQEDNRLEFYKLLTPQVREREDEMPRARDPKIRTREDVRNLREILGDEAAVESLLDPDSTLADALAIPRASAARTWLPRIRAACRALGEIPVETLKNMTREDVAPLIELRSALQERLDDWTILTREELES